MQKSLTTDGADDTDKRGLLGKVNAECGLTIW